MKFLKHIRSRSRVKDQAQAQVYETHPTPRSGLDASLLLPLKVLGLIFAEVCPHAIDDSYNSSEESMVSSGCALCDLKDLAQCALVSRRWRDVAQHMLYRNIRIEPVHYCEREYELAEKRKRKSFFDRNADPKDAPRERLLLLMRTVRANSQLAILVHTLRLPYMTREACKAELARTVAVLPNLRYVDLPEGFYSADVSSNALKQELQVSCPEIRRMKHNAGSERTFVALPQRRVWQSLEILELCGLHLEMLDLLYVLNSFPTLRDLKLVDLPWLDDSVFRNASHSSPLFPPVQRLTLQRTPLVTARGLADYLSLPQNSEVLTHLSLSSTGVPAQHLHHVLSRALYLESLTIIENVNSAFPSETRVAPLASNSLMYLHYEITSNLATPLSPRYIAQTVTTSYYSYLISSLLSWPPSLPNLRILYVRDTDFPDALLIAATPPPRPFAGGSSMAQSFGFTQALNIYTKGSDELEWNFTSVLPSAEINGRRGSMTGARPVSVMGAESLSSSWATGGRKSVVVGNGLGGFLAVPSENMPRPGSSGSLSSNCGGGGGGGGGGGRKERKDLWR